MDRPPLVLLSVGLVLALFAAATGGLSAGYSKTTAAFLLRIGVAYATIGVAALVVDPEAIQHAVAVVIVALVAMFAIGVAVMDYDFTVTASDGGTPLTVDLLVKYQSEFVLLLTPVPVGYLAGNYAREGEPRTAGVTMLATATLGWIAASAISRAHGSAPGFTEAGFLGFALVGLGFGLVPALAGYRAG